MCVRSVREIASSESACVFIGAADRRREKKVINIYIRRRENNRRKNAWRLLGYIWAVIFGRGYSM